MEDYYREILDEIDGLMRDNKLQQAFSVLEKELSMPYIPPEAEEKMQQVRKDLIYRMAEDREQYELSLDALLKRLKGKPQTQLAAAAALSERNLRSCYREINDWLSKDPQPEAAALIVEAIAEQEIDEEYTLMKNGVEYTFWGTDVIPVARSKGLHKAMTLLEEWIGNDHPDLFEMCRTVLIHEVYLFLPLSYDEEEGEELALSVLDQVSALMDEGRTAERIRREIRQSKKN